MVTPEKKCEACQCRRCALLPKCDVGDMSRLSPCDACEDKPYLTEGCRYGGEEPVTVKPQDVMDAFNRICTSLPKIQKLTDRRRASIRARGATLEEFEKAFLLVEGSNFLKSWCNFDWIIRPNNWQKIIEGNFTKEYTKKQNQFNDHPQTRYTEADLRKSGIFVNLDGDEDEII